MDSAAQGLKVEWIRQRNRQLLIFRDSPVPHQTLGHSHSTLWPDGLEEQRWFLDIKDEKHSTET